MWKGASGGTVLMAKVREKRKKKKSMRMIIVIFVGREKIVKTVG